MMKSLSLQSLLRVFGVMVLGAGLAASGLSAAEFIGRLAPKPTRGHRSFVRLIPATPEWFARLPVTIPGDAVAWTPVRPVTVKGRMYACVVVAAPDGSATFWFDRDGDGHFATGEAWPVAAGEDTVDFSLPWEIGFVREFPIRFEFSRRDPFGDARTSEQEDATRLAGMGFNFNVVFEAEVDLDGRILHVTFAPRPAEEVINLNTARISMDANFNGRIELNLGEVENPTGKSPVFRVGSRYLSVKSVDMASGVVVVDERPASEYTRFEARPGQEMPDFAFTTLEGARHRLSDFRGKYVLLDFWGTWCGPCIAEMKQLDPVYQKYHTRGLEVIGMNMEKTAGNQAPEIYAEDEAKVKAFIAKAGHRWLQATQASIERVAIEIIHVNTYPTLILLDRDGRVVTREARGEELAAMLERLLP